MSELTVGVNSSETLWTVDAVPDPEFGFYTIGSEIVQVIAGFPAGDPGYAVGQTFPAKIRVVRGTNGTSAASHLSGAALTAANAFSGGGATPTLAEVLGEDNFTDGQSILGGDDAAGALLLLPSVKNGDVVLTGGEGIADSGGIVYISGGASSGALGAKIQLDGAYGAADPGFMSLRSGGSDGSIGQVGTSDGTYFNWTDLLSSAAGVPGGSFTTPLYLDTTGVSGGLYAWNGSSYTKVAGALS